MYEHLAWDSDFFCFSVAHITSPSLNAEGLEKVLNELRRKKYSLAYWFISSEDKHSNNAAECEKGYLADERVSFTTVIEPKDAASFTSIRDYSGETNNPDLTDLALQSGEFSRFKRDPHFPPGKFEDMYRIWINRSITREIADSVLVYPAKGAIKGMVTLKIFRNQGYIGLFSVDRSVRGQNIGYELFRAAKGYLAQRRIKRFSVRTQRQNVRAVRFYVKCGFSPEKRENVYHFWLNKG